jgi:hypothetical protein
MNENSGMEIREWKLGREEKVALKLVQLKKMRFLRAEILI